MKKEIRSAILLVLIMLLTFSMFGCGLKKNKKPDKQTEQKKPDEEIQTEVERVFPKYIKPQKRVVDNADYYVSVKTGSDSNEGSKEKPFKTIQKARDVIRQLISTNAINKNVTVAVMGGEYNFKNTLNFDQRDVLPNGHRITCTSYDANEVTISGAQKFNGSDFKDISESDKARLSVEAREKVKVLNLFEKGITAEEIDKLYSIGGFAQGRKYGEPYGHAEAVDVFYGDKKMAMARYPNAGYSKIVSVVDYGQASEHSDDIIDWNSTNNPRPPKFIVEDDMKERMQRWQKPISELNSIWSYGYYYHDWADASTPVVDFHKSNGQLDVKYSSPYGIQKYNEKTGGGSHYVYNVFEELDCEGEYYLDRVTGNLYVYFPHGNASDVNINISLLKKSLIETNDKAKNVTFDGMTLAYTRNDAINSRGNDIVISNMLIKNIVKNGIRVQGFNNIVRDNEIFNIGKSGVYVGRDLGYKEGDISNDIRKDGLVMENNIVKNNYIHKYGEIQRTYAAGVYMVGVGNKAQHNEIFDAPHVGIFYAGNEHIIEYNYVHHVVKESNDAGAIYAGRNLSYFGNVIRYNAITDIGSEKFRASGIYFDDCLAGQVAYGNLLANIPDNGFLIGGGREHKIYNNVIVNAKKSILYDARAYDGLKNNGWYKANVNSPNGRHWKLMRDAQALYANWLKDSTSVDIMNKSEVDYKSIIKMKGYDEQDDPDNATIPNGIVTGNILISETNSIGNVSEVVKKHGKIESNKTYLISDSTIKASFMNIDDGMYAIKRDSLIAKENSNYDCVPYNKIGRINE